MYVIMKIYITNKQFDKTEKIGMGRSVIIRIGRALIMTQVTIILKLGTRQVLVVYALRLVSLMFFFFARYQSEKG
jgi:hypothetical protein